MLKRKTNYAVFIAVGAVLLLSAVGVGVAVTRPAQPTVAVVTPPAPVNPPKPTPPPSDPIAKPDVKTPPTPVAVDPIPSSPPADVEPEPKTAKRRLGGRRVVLEYEKTQAAAPIPPADDPETVTRAREAYLRGNARLFSGDAAGALAAYQETLKIYPGYVAGYRGLGLAYAQQGRTDEAVGALKTYVRTVPQAKDVPLLKRRIDSLERSR